MLQDYRLGLRMLLKYPGLTVAGGLALAIAIAIGAGWYDLAGKLFSPTIPLPEGDRIVAVETQNVLTNTTEFRVAHDFLEWRRELRTIEDLGAFRIAPRNLTIDRGIPERIQMAEITATAMRTARVPPLLGRILIESDDVPGAPEVVVLGYDLWKRSFGARQDVIGSDVTLGERSATVVGVMPDGFGYPFNFGAWTPLRLRASYGALEGGRISVIGRLRRGVSRAQADAEVRAIGTRTAAALPATHKHLRPRVLRLGEPGDEGEANFSTLAMFGITNLPVLVVLLIACTSVGTLVYARTATREGEIALRSALGASRIRIVGQLFVEALVLATVAAAVGLVLADRTLRLGIEGAYTDEGGIPFWITPGLSTTTIVYAGVLAIATAAMLSLLPALRVTRARVQGHLTSLGTTGATLRFGRFWTSALVAQVALTALGIPVAMDSVDELLRINRIRARFPSRDYLTARVDVNPRFEEEATPALAERRARALAELERRIAREPGVVAITFADRAPGTSRARDRVADIESSPGAGPAFEYRFSTSAVGPGFFDAFDRSIIAGRALDRGDEHPNARAVIVNEAFARGFERQGGKGSPIGTRLRYSDSVATGVGEPWLEIVGVVRDLGMDPDDDGNEVPFVFSAASAGTVEPLVITVRVRGNPAPLVARLPSLAADVDAGWSVRDAQPLDESQQEGPSVDFAAGLAAVTGLVLFLSALSIFSLLSVNVARRTREIGLRIALGENPRRVATSILTRAAVLMGSGIAVGGGTLLFIVALRDYNVGDFDLARFSLWLVLTALIMLGTAVLASIVPTRRALRINPIDALRNA